MLQDTARFHDCCYSMPTTTEIGYFEVQMKSQELVSLIDDTNNLFLQNISSCGQLLLFVITSPQRVNFVYF